MKYIFDFDNTIVYTDEVNSSAYNEALKICGYEPLCFKGRITRKIIAEQYPEISKSDFKRVINTKKEIFIKNAGHVKFNNRLINIIKTLGAENCILWTRAESERVNFILEKYNLGHLFCTIKHSDKGNVQKDIEWFVDFLKCDKNDLCFIEDDDNIIKKIASNSVKSVNVNNVKNKNDITS